MDDNSTAIAQPDSKKIQPWTGGQKAGWFFVGLSLGIPGIIIASLANVNHPDRSTATKMAAIGMGVEVALIVISFVLFFMMMSAVAIGAASGAASYY